MRISDWSSDVCSSDLVRDVEEIRAEHATVRSVLAIDDQIDRAAVLANADIRMRGGQCCQRGLDGATGGIGGMHDAAMAVTAFARQMQVRAARFTFFLGARHALFEKPAAAEIGRAHVCTPATHATLL